jgi:hypothetical protein
VNRDLIKSRGVTDSASLGQPNEADPDRACVRVRERVTSRKQPRQREEESTRPRVRDGTLTQITQ